MREEEEEEMRRLGGRQQKYAQEGARRESRTGAGAGSIQQKKGRVILLLCHFMSRMGRKLPWLGSQLVRVQSATHVSAGRSLVCWCLRLRHFAYRSRIGRAVAKLDAPRSSATVGKPQAITDSSLVWMLASN